MVIGGDGEAVAKAAVLAELGAHVVLLSPDVKPELRSVVDATGIQWHRRSYRRGDLAGAFLAVCSDGEAVDAVRAEATRERVLLNAVDMPEHCDFIWVSSVRRGPLTLSVMTGGASPAVAKKLRAELEERYGPEYGELTGLLGELRPRVFQAMPDKERRKRFFYELIESGLLDVLRTEGPEVARRYAEEMIARAGDAAAGGRAQGRGTRGTGG